MLTFELLLRGGRVLDPGLQLDGPMDVAVNGDRIAAVGPNLRKDSAVRVINLAPDDIVVPGLIDLHAHVARGITRHSCDPDRVGVEAGVTTVVDGGSVGSHTFVGFRTHVVSKAKTRVLSFLNLSFYGQARMPELRTAEDFDAEVMREVVRANPDVIVGAKTRSTMPAIATLGSGVVDLAHGVLDGLPLMVHLGDHGHSDLSNTVTREVVARLVPGDIITHPYTPFPGGLWQGGALIPECAAARERGVLLDVARGRMNFSFGVARKMLDAGIVPDTLSTDITVMNRALMVFGLTDTMSAFLALGCSLPQVIDMTTRRPAQALHLDDQIGSLKVGRKADISVIRHVRGSFAFEAEGEPLFDGAEAIYPVMCVRDGKRYDSAPPPGSAGEQARAVDTARVEPEIIQA